jgi:predicted transcriptional regulator
MLSAHSVVRSAEYREGSVKIRKTRNNLPWGFATRLVETELDRMRTFRNRELGRRLGIDNRTIADILYSMRRTGIVRRIKHGVYQAVRTPSGVQPHGALTILPGPPEPDQSLSLERIGHVPGRTHTQRIMNLLALVSPRRLHVLAIHRKLGVGRQAASALLRGFLRRGIVECVDRGSYAFKAAPKNARDELGPALIKYLRDHPWQSLGQIEDNSYIVACGRRILRELESLTKQRRLVKRGRFYALPDADPTAVDLSSSAYIRARRRERALRRGTVRSRPKYDCVEYARYEILAALRQYHGPTCARLIAKSSRHSFSVVASQLPKLCNEGLVVREKMRESRTGRRMYHYRAVPLDTPSA